MRPRWVLQPVQPGWRTYGRTWSLAFGLALCVMMISCAGSPPRRPVTTQVVKVSPVNGDDQLARSYSVTFHPGPARCQGWLHGEDMFLACHPARWRYVLAVEARHRW
jgi:hypothetical protein